MTAPDGGPLPVWLKVHPDGVSVEVAAQPNAKRTEVVGLHGGALKIKVASPPVEGAANDVLLDFLAARLGVKRRDVSLLRGATGRRKAVLIKGVTYALARQRLAPP